MAKILAVPVGREGIAPREISPRFRSQLVYFMSSPGETGVPPLGEFEYWFDPEQVAKWLDDGVFYLVSPLDTANMTEVEISEEQEDFLQWLGSNDVKHIRIVG